MRTHRSFLVFLGTSVILLTANAAIIACWCVDKGPVLDQFESSKHVIAARVISADSEKATMLVLRVYKGSTRVGTELHFVQGRFADCVLGFDPAEIGKEYLFYLNSPTKKDRSAARPAKAGDVLYSASLCSRSNPLSLAYDDLAYLDKIDSVTAKTRLSGNVRTKESSPPNLEGLLITVTGKKKTSRVRTDTNGFYEIYDLPPGNYVVEAQIPDGWRFDRKYMFGLDDTDARRSTDPELNRYQIQIKARRHRAINITIIRILK